MHSKMFHPLCYPCIHKQKHKQYNACLPARSMRRQIMFNAVYSIESLFLSIQTARPLARSHSKILFLANVCTTSRCETSVWCTWRMALSMKITSCECQCAPRHEGWTNHLPRPCTQCTFVCGCLCVCILCLAQYGAALLSFRLDNNGKQKLIADATTNGRKKKERIAIAVEHTFNATNKQ